MSNHILAKKHFSQNFLVDLKAKTRVAKAMQEVCNYDGYQNLPIIEIGPGQGDITKQAVLWGQKLIAIEIDPEAVDYLNSAINETNFELIHGDAMVLFQDLEGNNLPINFSLISSLPYHIGSRILVDLAISCPQVNFGVIHQKEVIIKTQSDPKIDQKLTFFGAWLNLFWDCKHCFDIAPHCFSPKPKVYSAFLQGKSLNSQNMYWLNTVEKRIVAKNILKNLFANPKKTLINNLKNLNWDQYKILKFIKINCQNDLNTRLNWQNYNKILEAAVEFEK